MGLTGKAQAFAASLNECSDSHEVPLELMRYGKARTLRLTNDLTLMKPMSGGMRCRCKQSLSTWCLKAQPSWRGSICPNESPLMGVLDELHMIRAEPWFCWPVSGADNPLRSR
jgi:hypothetical protein